MVKLKREREKVAPTIQKKEAKFRLTGVVSCWYNNLTSLIKAT